MKGKRQKSSRLRRAKSPQKRRGLKRKMIIKEMLANFLGWYKQHMFEAIAIKNYQHFSGMYGRELSEKEKIIYNQGS